MSDNNPLLDRMMYKSLSLEFEKYKAIIVQQQKFIADLQSRLTFVETDLMKLNDFVDNFEEVDSEFDEDDSLRAESDLEDLEDNIEDPKVVEVNNLVTAMDINRSNPFLKRR